MTAKGILNWVPSSYGSLSCLVTAVVQRFARSSERDRRDEA